MTSPDDLAQLANQKYVALTTFRKPKDGAATGIAVSTPVWIAERHGTLLVMTQADAGKVKRIRHTPTVTLQASTGRGVPIEGAPVVTGTAQIRSGAEVFAEAVQSFGKKYGLTFRLFRLVGRRRDETSVVLEISLE